MNRHALVYRLAYNGDIAAAKRVALKDKAQLRRGV